MVDVWTETSINVGVHVRVNALVRVLTTIGAGILAEVDTNVLRLTMPAPLERLSAFCSARFSCWPMALLDCDCVLQAWMPSCHV